MGLSLQALLLALAITVTMSAPSVYAAGLDEDYVYTVTKGDTLIGLTTHLLRKPSDWPDVARHNKLRDRKSVV